MILNCPECKARFLVADALIPNEGRTVRCGNCAHQWHVERPTNLEPLEAVEPTPPAEGDPAPEAAAEAAAADAAPVDEFAFRPRRTAPASNVPALAPKKKNPYLIYMIAAPTLAVLWLVLAMMTYFPSWVNAPGIGAIYGMFGVTDTSGLAFAEVAMEREDTETKTRFILSGKIINRAKEKRTVPIVHVSMHDKEGGEIWGRDYPVNLTLKPGEEYPFRIVNVETSFAERVATLRLDMGNSLELMVR